jgi:Mn-dependent DtxR family transcriptional regulator
MSKTKKRLTPRQKDTLEALANYCRSQSIPPTLYELTKVLSISAPRVHTLLLELVEAEAVVKIKEGGYARAYVPADSPILKEY